ncbi:unnamed protein product [Arctogadus glacialis]
MEHVVGSQGRSPSARGPGGQRRILSCLAPPRLHTVRHLTSRDAPDTAAPQGPRLPPPRFSFAGRVMLASRPRHKSPHCPPALKGALVFRVPGAAGPGPPVSSGRFEGRLRRTGRRHYLHLLSSTMSVPSALVSVCSCYVCRYSSCSLTCISGLLSRGV